MFARTTRRPSRTPAGLALVALAVVLLVAVPVAYAKGPPSLVTISGPGIQEPIEITDPPLLEAFAFYQFNNLELRTDPPANPGAGYTITRYVPRENGGELMPWDSLTYYPRRGAPGLIYFNGLNPSIGTTEGQGQWYLATPAGDAAMQRILAAQSKAPASRAFGPRQAHPLQSARLPL